ncbi:SAF domain-containing protein [Arthrobacter rhombi]|uniref:SAF domain-containing protein n=1 Tax=Arthrobacter rhombi TaxID=71253 RepID=UPI0031D98F27
MESEPGGPVRRLRKPGWKDPRLLVGLLLVAASVAGVLTLVSTQNQTVPMYVARQDIALGQKIDPAKLRVVDVRLDAVRDSYLSAEQPPADDLQANALIRSGELLPVASIGGRDPQGRKPLSVELPQELPIAVGVGTRVDVWAAERGSTSTTYGEPKRLLQAVEVSAIRERDAGFGVASGQLVELLVTDEDLPGMLSAIANDARLTVVNNPGEAGK